MDALAQGILAMGSSAFVTAALTFGIRVFLDRRTQARTQTKNNHLQMIHDYMRDALWNVEKEREYYRDRSTMALAQWEAAKRGLYHGPVDGVPGPNTVNAIRILNEQGYAPGVMSPGEFVHVSSGSEGEVPVDPAPLPEPQPDTRLHVSFRRPRASKVR